MPAATAAGAVSGPSLEVLRVWVGGGYLCFRTLVFGGVGRSHSRRRNLLPPLSVYSCTVQLYCRALGVHVSYIPKRAFCCSHDAGGSRQSAAHEPGARGQGSPDGKQSRPDTLGRWFQSKGLKGKPGIPTHGASIQPEFQTPDQQSSSRRTPLGRAKHPTDSHPHATNRRAPWCAASGRSTRCACAAICLGALFAPLTRTVVSRVVRHAIPRRGRTAAHPQLALHAA